MAASVLIDKDSSCLDDDDTRWRLEVAVERLDSHARFLETTFSRGAVNRGFRMWAVKNSQKRRSARPVGEKSVGVVVRGPGAAAAEASMGSRSGNMERGVYADCEGA